MKDEDKVLRTREKRQEYEERMEEETRRVGDEEATEG